MVKQVGTNVFYGQLTSRMRETSAQVSDAQLKASTGKNSQTYSGYGAGAKPIVTLTHKKDSMDRHISDNQYKIGRQDIMVATMRGLLDITSDFRTKLASLRSATPLEPSVFQGLVERGLDHVQALLNKTDNGEYLFAGSLNIAPVDLTKMPESVGSNSGPILTYYQGNDDELVVQIADGLNINYGVRANEPGIEKIIRAMKMSLDQDMGSDMNSSLLTQSMELAEKATTEISQILAKIAENQRYVIDINEQIKDDKVYVEQTLSVMQDADLPEVLTDLARHQTQLMALYMAMTSKKVSLVDYMR